MTFAALKQSSGKFDKLQAELEKINNPVSTSSFQDERFWKPELDKSGNGYAIIRFLPQPEGESLPWARVWSHAFSGPGGWYIENSLTTIGAKDPVSEYNTELWNSGNEADKDTARKQKRVLKYFANIYIVSDSKHPEYEGRVFLFRFGKKIFDKLTEAMNPAFDDEEALNPFDMWKGADFKLKIRKVDGYWNYDKSEFASPKQLLEDEDQLEAIYKKQYSLEAFTVADQFKTYDELKEKLHKTLTGSGVGSKNVTDFAAPTPKKPAVTEVAKQADGTDDDTLSYFSKLAEDD
tara:strand:- start:146 stop:1021 length:876 start_codon:yes stop_codon:yes gene_type:complete